MLNRETAIERVKLFARELLGHGITLDKVILFGSYSKNLQKIDSDIDVALVSEMFTGFGFEDRKLFSKINIKRDYIDIDTKTYSKEYYYQSDPFIEEINNTGIEILLT